MVGRKATKIFIRIVTSSRMFSKESVSPTKNIKLSSTFIVLII